MNEPKIKEMRDDIAEGISKTGNRQADIENQFQSVIAGTTGKDVISAPEILAARNGEANLNDRLTKKEQEFETEIAQARQDLSNKANQSELDSGLAAALDGGPSIYRNTLSALNSDYPDGASGTALVFETDPAYLYIWENGAWTKKTAYTGLKNANRSIDPIATTFFEISTNKFDKSTVTLNKSISSAGTPIDATDFVLSDFIRITELEKTIFKNARTYAYYKADKSFITGSRVELSEPFDNRVSTNATGSYWVRFTWYLPNLSITSQQVNIGDKLLPYEEHQIMPLKYKGNQKFSKNDVDFYIPEAISSKNRHKPSSEIKGFYINQANGEILANAPHSTFEINVKPNEAITFSSHNRSHFYNKGVPISGSGLLDNKSGEPVTRTVPYNADTMKYSFYYEQMTENFQVESGTVTTAYVKPGFKMPELNLSDKIINYFSEVNLPSKIYATVGEELKLYNGNLLKDNEEEFNIDWDCTDGKQMKDGFVITPTAAGTLALTLNVYKKTTLIKSKTTTIIASDKRTTPKKAIEVGDSTSIAAGFAYAVKRMKDKLGDNVVLLGTQGTSPVLYEGRGGWKAETYRTNTLYYDVVNPFYNPATQDFDFTYYMVQNGFSNVDVVILNLGINDVFGSKDDVGALAGATYSMTNTDFLIASILAYDPTIKIAITIAIPPNAHQDIYGNNPEVALYQTQWRAKYNNFIYAEKLISHYQGKYDLIPIHAVIDTVNNISDHVHPTEAGYYQIGDQKVNYLNSL